LQVLAVYQAEWGVFLFGLVFSYAYQSDPTLGSHLIRMMYRNNTFLSVIMHNNNSVHKHRIIQEMR